MTHISQDRVGLAAQRLAVKPKPPQRDTTRLYASPRCGARTRRGDPCRAPAVCGKARCRMHGGARGSGGQAGNRNARKHGRYDREAKAANRRHQGLLGSARALLRLLDAEARGRPLDSPATGPWRGNGPELGDRAGAAPAEILGCMGSFAKFAPGDVAASHSAGPPPRRAAGRHGDEGGRPLHGRPAPNPLCPARAGPLFCRLQGIAGDRTGVRRAQANERKTRPCRWTTHRSSTNPSCPAGMSRSGRPARRTAPTTTPWA